MKSDTTATATCSSQHWSKSLLVSHVHTPDCRTSVAASVLSSSSSIHSSSPSLSEISYDTSHLTPKCPLLAQDFFLQLAVIRSKNMHKPTGEKHPVIDRETYITTSAASKVVDAECHRHSIEIHRCPKHKKNLLLTRTSKREGPTSNFHESTISSRNSTGHTTGSIACTIGIGAYLSWRNKQTGQDAHKNSILFPDVVRTSTNKGRSKNMIIVNLAESLSFPTADANVAFVIIPTYEIGVTYEKFFRAMHTAVAFF